MMAKGTGKVVLAVGVSVVTLSLMGCSGGRGISHPAVSEPTRATESVPVAETPEGGDAEETLQAEDTAPTTSESTPESLEASTPEPSPDNESGITRGVQTYDWIWTVKPDFGSMKHGPSAFVTGNTKVVGNIKVNAKAGNSTVSNAYAFYLKIEQFNPPKGSFTKISLLNGLKKLNWRKVGGKLQGIVDSPAALYFKSEPTVNGTMHAEVTDVVGKGKVGDKVQIWFTGSNKTRSFNNALLFDLTTDSSAGKNRGFLNLVQNQKSSPND